MTPGRWDVEHEPDTGEVLLILSDVEHVHRMLTISRRTTLRLDRDDARRLAHALTSPPEVEA